MIALNVYDAGQSLGRVYVPAHAGRVTAEGAPKLAGSLVTRHGKTLTAKLAVKLPQSLAGKDLRLAVEAADRHGHRQMVPEAGELTVAR